MTEFYEVTQTETDQTAAIVFETAKRTVESDLDSGEYLQVFLKHDEDPHFNLGFTEEYMDDIDEDLQFRRFGGGNRIGHDNTHCYMRSKTKEHLKKG